MSVYLRSAPKRIEIYIFIDCVYAKIQVYMLFGCPQQVIAGYMV